MKRQSAPRAACQTAEDRSATAAGQSSRPRPRCGRLRERALQNVPAAAEAAPSWYVAAACWLSVLCRRHLHGDCSRDHRRPVGARVHSRFTSSRPLPGWPLGRALFGSVIQRVGRRRAARVRADLPRFLGRPRRCGIPSALTFVLAWASLIAATLVDARCRARERPPLVALPPWSRARRAHARSPPAARSRRLRLSVQEPRGAGRSGQSLLSRLFHRRFHLAHGVDGGADEVRHAARSIRTWETARFSTTGRTSWFPP